MAEFKEGIVRVQNEGPASTGIVSDRLNTSEPPLRSPPPMPDGYSLVVKAGQRRPVRHRRGTSFGCRLEQVTDHMSGQRFLPDGLTFGLMTGKAHPERDDLPEIACEGYARAPVTFTPLNKYYLFANETFRISFVPRWDERPSHGALFDREGRLLAQGTIGGGYIAGAPEANFRFGERGVLLKRPPFMTEASFPGTKELPSWLRAISHAP